MPRLPPSEASKASIGSTATSTPTGRWRLASRATPEPTRGTACHHTPSSSQSQGRPVATTLPRPTPSSASPTSTKRTASVTLRRSGVPRSWRYQAEDLTGLSQHTRPPGGSAKGMTRGRGGSAQSAPRGPAAEQADPMTLALAGVLLVLALIDSTSFGTLLIPLWLMLSPGRLRAGRILLFLGVVASVYLALGIVLSAGLEQVLQIGNGWVEHPFVIRGQFVLGLGLLIGSFFIARKKSGSQAGSGRLQRWRDRAMADGAGSGTLIGLAMGAVVLEVATMLPYLGAIGLLSTSTLPLATRTVALVGYCLVMVAPALLLLLARILLHHQVAGPLQRLATWMQAKAGETTAWIVGIVGFLIARDAVGRMPEILGFLDNLG